MTECRSRAMGGCLRGYGSGTGGSLLLVDVRMNTGITLSPHRLSIGTSPSPTALRWVSALEVAGLNFQLYTEDGSMYVFEHTGLFKALCNLR